jgi:2-dehydro-3-deoxyphosphogluconate aldolase/(4S)-4-hydroxy-2-oxoglutarate aldolase
MDAVLQKIGELGVVPVVSIENEGAARQLGQALLDGGLPCAEITFRTAAAANVIRTLVEAYPDMLVGAGTVLDTEQARTAVGMGARFIVAPGFDPEVVDWCLENGVPVTPGVVTPTEISIALGRGLAVLKFFPAELMGGLETLRAIAGPYRNARFIPTGGVNAHNLGNYLRHPSVHACGGSWLVKSRLIAAGGFSEITRRVREAVVIARKAREEMKSG